MDSLNNRAVLVTGANRGLGRTFCCELLNAGIGKIYAGARNPSEIDIKHRGIIPVKLDVTSSHDISAAAQTCTDTGRSTDAPWSGPWG